jgi:hypothetical protein
MPIIGATDIQPMNVLEQYAKGLEVGAAERALERQEVDRIKAAEQNRALNEMYARAMKLGGQVDVNALYGMLASGGMGAMIPGMQAQRADVAFKEAQARKQLSDAETAQFKNQRDLLAAVTDQPGYNVWRANALKTYAGIPGVEALIPAQFSPEVKQRLLMTADAALPKGEVREVGGVLSTIDPYTGKEIGKVDYSATEQAARRAGAPSTKIQNWVPASETAQKEFIQEFRDTYKQLKTAPTDIANLRRAAELSKTEGRKYFGTGGDAFLSAAKFLKNRLGFDIDKEALASAEEARALLFQNVLNNLRKLDAQPSQQQQLIMQQALGSLDTDPDALARVVQVYEDVIRGRVEQHNREFAEMKANPNLANAFPYSLEIKLPEPVKKPSGAPAGSADSASGGRFKVTVVNPPR